MRGPKRAARIRKMFNLGKEDDVRHYVKIYGKKVGGSASLGVWAGPSCWWGALAAASSQRLEESL